LRIQDLEPIHEQIYRALQSREVVRDKADFSRNFFGRSRNYMHVLSHCQLLPSDDAYRFLRERLCSLAGQSICSDADDTIERFIRRLDERLLNRREVTVR